MPVRIGSYTPISLSLNCTGGGGLYVDFLRKAVRFRRDIDLNSFLLDCVPFKEVGDAKGKD